MNYKDKLTTTTAAYTPEPVFGSKILFDMLEGNCYSFEWVLKEAKKKFGWKYLTQKRMQKIVRFAYYLGRQGIKPPERKWCDRIPRAKNAGLTENFNVITANKRKVG